MARDVRNAEGINGSRDTYSSADEIADDAIDGESMKSSQSESESEMDDEGNSSAAKEEEVTYRRVRLQVMDYPFTQEVLKGDESELWLVRMPRYDAFVTGLSGREIEITENEAGKAIVRDGEITGRLKGYYGFRDYGSEGVNERAAFVVKDGSGKEKLEIAKPFSRSVRVTFDAPLTNRGDKGPPPRSYPTLPDGTKSKYRPIGSGTASVRGLANGSIPVNSSSRKRKNTNVGTAVQDRSPTSRQRQRVALAPNPATLNGNEKRAPGDKELSQRPSPRRKKTQSRHHLNVEPT